MDNWFLTTFVFSAVLVHHNVWSYPYGAPADTCLTMFPKHEGTQTQFEWGVYQVTTDVTTYTPGSKVVLTISSTRGEDFKGVQVRARRTEINLEEIVGSYENLIPADKLRYIDCQGKTHNMVTHLNNISVSSVQMTWVAPNANVGPVVFEVTVVQSYYVFYFGLQSEVINPAAGSPPITPPLFRPPLVNNTVAPIDWDACGKSKGCLLYPRYCSGDNCKVAVSYVLNKVEETATFEMMVKDSEYISLGFSRDMEMGDDQTITCASVYDQVTIQSGWNHPYKFNVQEMREEHLTKLEASSNMDGIITCRFTRPISMQLLIVYEEFEPFNPFNMTFDLNDDHYLFIAWGKTYEKTDIMGYHNEMPVMSETKIDFTDHDVYRGSVMPKLVRAHSSMMAVAWMGFAGLAIVMARYYKDGFNDKKICGIKVWFHIHRVSAIMTFALTVAGLVVILIEEHGEITDLPSAHTHMCLGFTVVALVCAQVLGGLVRPGPNSKIRPLFNFFHRFLGTAALVIAAAALICAYKIEHFTYEAQRFGERTVAVWAGVFVFMEILHGGYQYLASKVLVHRSRSDEYNLDKDNFELEPTESAPPSHFLLFIFLIFIACSIAAALIMTIFF